MKVFITRVIPDPGLQLLRAAGIEYLQWEEQRDLRQDELIAYCKNSDALISAGPNKLDAGFLHACSNLKVIALHSVGYDNVDIDTANALKIPVGNTPDVLSNATADTAFLLMLATSRKAFYLHKTIARGAWTFFDPKANLGIELRGKTLGVFGLGKIGFEMARLCASAFDMRIIYHNRGNNALAEDRFRAKKVSFNELLAESDVLSVHSALNPDTREVFNLTAFKKMKATALFINTARGGIHNETDLVTALREGMIWGAGLDVTNPEPMDPQNLLLNMPNVCVLPHIGSATVEARDGMSRMAAENIVAGLSGRNLPYPINRF